MSFSAFLVGTTLVSSLALVAMLATPNAEPPRFDRAPVVGAAVLALVAALGFIGGLAVAG